MLPMLTTPGSRVLTSWRPFVWTGVSPRSLLVRHKHILCYSQSEKLDRHLTYKELRPGRRPLLAFRVFYVQKYTVFVS